MVCHFGFNDVKPDLTPIGSSQLSFDLPLREKAICQRNFCLDLKKKNPFNWLEVTGVPIKKIDLTWFDQV